MFIITHNNLENEIEGIASIKNKYEAKYLINYVNIFFNKDMKVNKLQF